MAVLYVKLVLPWTYAVDKCPHYEGYRDVVISFLRGVERLLVAHVQRKREFLAVDPDWGEPEWVRAELPQMYRHHLVAIDGSEVVFPHRRLRCNAAAQARARVISGVKAGKRVALRLAFANELRCPVCRRQGGEWVRCDRCNVHSHVGCVNTTQLQLLELPRGTEWLCPKCDPARESARTVAQVRADKVRAGVAPRLALRVNATGGCLAAIAGDVACIVLALPLSRVAASPGQAVLLLTEALRAVRWQLQREIAALPKRSSEDLLRMLGSPLTEGTLEGAIMVLKQAGDRAGGTRARQLCPDFLRAKVNARMFDSPPDEVAAAVPDAVLAAVEAAVGLRNSGAGAAAQRGDVALRALELKEEGTERVAGRR
eukprot:gene351-2926_t